MWGIFGYVGGLGASCEVITGLKRLQYRGYDSCGVAFFDEQENNFRCIKAVGTLSELEQLWQNERTGTDIDTSKKVPHIAFGHTRWATNGEVSLKNTHPHISFDRQITIVHNGIIKNWQKIKDDLMSKNHNITFNSDTDSEVVANLLAAQVGSLDERIKNLFDLLDGSFALIIGVAGGDLYLVKKFCPLNLIISDEGIYISSDVSSMRSGRLYSLQDNDIIKISKASTGSLEVCLLDERGKDIPLKEYYNRLQDFELNSAYPHFMIKEIFETPTAIFDTYNSLKQVNVQQIFSQVKKITMLGCGTAFHSCLIGENLLKNKFDFQIESVIASNFRLDRAPHDEELFVIVSQSGETADCIKVAAEIKERSGKILLITNEPNSTMTKFADEVIFTRAGKEHAVASTKTYCCQIFVFAFLCNKLQDKNYDIDIGLFRQRLGEFIHSLDLSQLSEKLKDVDKMILIALEADYLTMLEASLKIREIDYVYTLPIYANELKHGTLSLIDEGSTVLSLNTDQAQTDKLRTAINEIQSRRGNVIEMERLFDGSCIDDFGAEYRPIFAIIPFQLLSYNLAIKKGTNPDMPRNLAKSVTVE